MIRLPLRAVPTHPVIGIAVTLLLLAVLLCGLKAYRVRCPTHPEILRKLLHVGMGLVTLSFPWMFADPLPVAVLAALAALLLRACRAQGPLARIMGGVADGVARETRGDYYFPLGVATLFWLSHREPVLYCIPILLLTLGDAAAALVGVRFGRMKFGAEDGEKSAEGSLACFMVLLLCTALPLMVSHAARPPEALLVALIVAIVGTLLEAVAWRGLDNLFLPLGGYFLLRSLLPLCAAALAGRLMVTLSVCLFVILWRRRTALRDSAALGAALYGYAAWSIGGAPWIVAPLFLFVCYPLLWPRTDRDAARRHSISVVLAVGFGGLIWLFLAAVLHRPNLLFLYNVAFGAQMAMIGIARLRHRYPHRSGRLLLPTAVLAGWLLLVVPSLVVLWSEPRHALACAAWGLLALFAATAAFDRIRHDLVAYPCDPARWRLQAGLGTLCTLIALVPLTVRAAGPTELQRGAETVRHRWEAAPMAFRPDQVRPGLMQQAKGGSGRGHHSRG